MNHNKIASVNDPDKKIKSWRVLTRDDQDILEWIEDRGSLEVFFESEDDVTGDKTISRKLFERGFTLRLEEEVRYFAQHSDYGNDQQSLLLAFLNKVCDSLSVVGDLPEDWRLERFTESYSRSSDGPRELPTWLSSALELVGFEGINCFLYGQFSLSKTEVETAFRALFPNTKGVYFGADNFSVSFLKLRQLGVAVPT